MVADSLQELTAVIAAGLPGPDAAFDRRSRRCSENDIQSDTLSEVSCGMPMH